MREADERAEKKLHEHTATLAAEHAAKAEAVAAEHIAKAEAVAAEHAAKAEAFSAEKLAVAESEIQMLKSNIDKLENELTDVRKAAESANHELKPAQISATDTTATDAVATATAYVPCCFAWHFICSSGKAIGKLHRHCGLHACWHGFGCNTAWVGAAAERRRLHRLQVFCAQRSTRSALPGRSTVAHLSAVAQECHTAD